MTTSTSGSGSGSGSGSQTEAAARALYDARYAGSYRAKLSGYEVARFSALGHFIPRVAKASSARTVLDYGSGSGLHVPLWEEVFPGAAFSFADLSGKALEKLGAKHPAYAARTHLVVGDHVDLPSESFDAVVSVEVMEHVEHLDRYLGEISRLLKPGGFFIWTTPCANALSIEHVYNALTGQIDATPSGSRRWRWEEPTHVRRLKTAEAKAACGAAGFDEVDFRFRAHFFSFACTKLLMKRLPKLAERLMLLDYALFRRLPNGASMIGCARKSREAGSVPALSAIRAAA
jgi:SAM-dependent methyltransferase